MAIHRRLKLQHAVTHYPGLPSQCFKHGVSETLSLFPLCPAPLHSHQPLSTVPYVTNFTNGPCEQCHLRVLRFKSTQAGEARQGWSQTRHTEASKYSMLLLCIGSRDHRSEQGRRGGAAPKHRRSRLLPSLTLT